MRHLLFLLLATAISCTQTAEKGQNLLNPDAFEALLKKEPTAQLVDVRTPGEFQEGHLAGAKNINIQDGDFSQKIGQLDKNRPVMVYCAVGGRSGRAAAQLNKMGFLQVYDLQGGIKAWNAAGKAVTQ